MTCAVMAAMGQTMLETAVTESEKRLARDGKAG